MTVLKNKIVTVFGGSGFVGRNLVAALVREGAIIRAASRVKNCCYELRTGALPGQVVPIQVDYGDEKSIRSAIRGSDYVVNLIGTLTENRRHDFQDIHVALAEKISRCAAKLKIKHLVHISALGADTHAESHYQQSKALGEAAILKNFPGASILRPSVMFGEGDGFFSRFARLMRILPVFPLIGGGKTKFQPVYVGDVVEAIMAALAHHGDVPENFKGTVIECAGPEIYTFKRLLHYIRQQTGRHVFLMPVPFTPAKIAGWFLEKLPGKVLTPDQVRVLKLDNIESGARLTLEDIGIVPTPVEVIVPDYLEAYRTGGEFSAPRRYRA